MSAFSNSVFQFTGYSAGIYPFDNIEALRRIISTTIADKAHAIVDGGIVPADGAGGFYVWSATSTDADNGSSVICPNDLGPTEPGRWQLVSLTGSVGIKYAEIDANGHLQITRPDNTIIDCGVAVGPQGYTGATGPTGKAATVTLGTVTTGDPGSAVAITNSGTSSDAVLDITIPRGDKGETGSTGSSATVAIGSVTTGAAGSATSVVNSGTATNAILNIQIPRGDSGETGPQGDRGDIGPSPTIAIGTVASGDTAAVTNSGTNSAATFNFTLPRGDKGDQGIQGIQGVPGQDGSSDAQTLAGQAPSYYTDIKTRLGYTPVDVSGATAMTGDLTILKNNPTLWLNTSGMGDATTNYQTSGNLAFTAGYSPTNDIFYINRFDTTQNGAYAGTPLQIRRTDGQMSTGTINVGGDLLVAQTIYATGNANGGRNQIKIGDDAWIGDYNIANGINIRGDQNSNAGWIVFGSNNQSQLGCNGSDGYLRWTGDVAINNWYRSLGDNGHYWESRGRGINVADSGASYGNITTYGNGLNGWTGYSIGTWSAFMANGSQIGVHCPQAGNWIWYSDFFGNTTFTGNVTAFSDERLKQNIRTIDDPWKIICGMEGIRYERDGKTRVGLGAQTTRKVLPEVVFEADDLTRTLSVNYGDVVGPIIEALKDANVRIMQLENKINDLESKLNGN